ncbi:hypothetical protein niasHT_030430 [Heterodera trifolii]|uniref:Uncharacterized protein n=1 Tax=Heterodera trifolii TaxID=157864 RepID=A0ABD2IJY9_9BILA
MQFFGLLICFVVVLNACVNPIVLTATLAKALKATLTVGGIAAYRGWKAFTKTNGILDQFGELMKEKPDLFSPLFPLTFAIAGGEVLVEQDKFEMDYIFNLFERLTERDQLDKICFDGVNGEKNMIEKAEKNLPLVFLYAVMNGRKLDVYLCD